MVNQDFKNMQSYDGSSQNNQEALKKLKQFSQSRIMIYGFVIAFFVFVGVRFFVIVSGLEKIYPTEIPAEAMNEAFGSNASYGMYTALGKWGFLGAALAMALFVYVIMIHPHVKKIKNYNQLIKN